MTIQSLEVITTQLRDAATELSAQDIAPERAAELVESCARLAAQAGAAIERVQQVQEVSVEGVTSVGFED